MVQTLVESTNTVIKVLQCVFVVDIMGIRFSDSWVVTSPPSHYQLANKTSLEKTEKPPQLGNYWEKAPPTDMETESIIMRLNTPA